jgi:hypothetical protein
LRLIILTKAYQKEKLMSRRQPKNNTIINTVLQNRHLIYQISVVCIHQILITCQAINSKLLFAGSSKR